MERQLSLVILQSCSVSREKCYLLHSMSSGCVRFCTVRIIEQVILNLDYHGSVVNTILDPENHGFLVDTYFKTCHITMKVPRFS